jgi:hypothetical protein
MSTMAALSAGGAAVTATWGWATKVVAPLPRRPAGQAAVHGHHPAPHQRGVGLLRGQQDPPAEPRSQSRSVEWVSQS